MLEIKTDLLKSFGNLSLIDIFVVKRSSGGVLVANGRGNFDFGGCGGRSIGLDGDGVIPFGGEINFCRSGVRFGDG